MNHHLKTALSHVLWIGGSPCSGKSSICEILAGRHNLQTYHCDALFDAHLQRATRADSPAFHQLQALLSGPMSWDNIWMRPVDVLINHELAIYNEEFAMICDDLLAMPNDRPIIAEGAALLPERVAPLLSAPHQAIWIVPTPAFQLEHYSQRPWIRDILQTCTDPDQAFQNWMARDAGFAQTVIKQAETHALTTMIVDGQRTIAENTAFVEAHFNLNHR